MADYKLEKIQHQLTKVQTERNEKVRAFNGLVRDPARWALKETWPAWSFNGRLYQITHIHPTDDESAILIRRFIVQRDADLSSARREVDMLDKARNRPGSVGSGYLYVMTNASIRGLKVGGTRRTPEERARELSTPTGIPTPYAVVYYERVSDWRAAEAAAHLQLAQFRITDRREFFDTEPKRVIDVLRAIATQFSESEQRGGLGRMGRERRAFSS